MASCPTNDLFRVVTDRIARVFNDSGATGAVGLDISRCVFRIVLNIYDKALLKKLLTTLTYFSHFTNPLPPVRSCLHWDDPPPLPPSLMRTSFMDGPY